MFGNRKLPRRKDIVIYGDLDEESAAKNFLGKDLMQAEAMFRDNFLRYGEDLMWMGPKAFCFYVEAAINYLLSEEAFEDSDAVNSFLTAVRFQKEHYASDIEPAYPMIKTGIKRLLVRFDHYACNVNIYGELETDYRDFLGELG